MYKGTFSYDENMQELTVNIEVDQVLRSSSVSFKVRDIDLRGKLDKAVTQFAVMFPTYMNLAMNAIAMQDKGPPKTNREQGPNRGADGKCDDPLCVCAMVSCPPGVTCMHKTADKPAPKRRAKKGTK